MTHQVAGMKQRSLINILVCYAVGLLTALIITTISARKAETPFSPLPGVEDLKGLIVMGLTIMVPFLIIPFIGSAPRRGAAVTAAVTFLAWALMWRTILRADPMIIGANIGAGLVILTPFPITLAAVAVEAVLNDWQKKNRVGRTDPARQP